MNMGGNSGTGHNRCGTCGWEYPAGSVHACLTPPSVPEVPAGTAERDGFCTCYPNDSPTCSATCGIKAHREAARPPVSPPALTRERLLAAFAPLPVFTQNPAAYDNHVLDAVLRLLDEAVAAMRDTNFTSVPDEAIWKVTRDGAFADVRALFASLRAEGER